MHLARYAVGIVLLAMVMVLPDGRAFATDKAKPAPASTGIDALDKADITPGASIKIDDPATGGRGYWMLEIPRDYDPSRSWPVIFVLHGSTATPSTWPFGDLDNGKSFILVGLEYEQPGNSYSLPEKNLPNIKRIHDALAKKLPIDEKLQFLGGLSLGGYRAADYGEASLQAWAGIIILLGGRGDYGAAHPNLNGNYQQKPILIADGMNDTEYQHAQDAAKFYTAHNADVTTVWFPGLGHEVDTKNQVLRKWLFDHGPLAQVKMQLDDAKAAQKVGKLGHAYALYQAVAGQDISADLAAQAKTAADALEADAKKQSDRAEADLSVRLSTGMRELADIARTYAGSPMGDQAAARLADLRSHPPTRPASVSSAATPPAPSESAPTTAPAAAPPDADKQCKSWLSLADSYLQGGDPDRAKTYLQKIIDNYPKSPYADTARDELKKMQ